MGSIVSGNIWHLYLFFILTIFLSCSWKNHMVEYSLIRRVKLNQNEKWIFVTASHMVVSKDENGRNRTENSSTVFYFYIWIRKRKRKRTNRTRKRTRTYGISRISKTKQFERNYIEHGRYTKTQYGIPTRRPSAWLSAYMIKFKCI